MKCAKRTATAMKRVKNAVPFGILQDHLVFCFVVVLQNIWLLTDCTNDAILYNR